MNQGESDNKKIKLHELEVSLVIGNTIFKLFSYIFCLGSKLPSLSASAVAGTILVNQFSFSYLMPETLFLVGQIAANHKDFTS